MQFRNPVGAKPDCAPVLGVACFWNYCRNLDVWRAMVERETQFVVVVIAQENGINVALDDVCLGPELAAHNCGVPVYSEEGRPQEG